MIRVTTCCALVLSLAGVGCLMLTTQEDRHACDTDADCATTYWCRGVAQIEDADCEEVAEDNLTGLPHVKLLDSCFYFYCVEQGTIQCGDVDSCDASESTCVVTKQETAEQDRPWRAEVVCAPRVDFPADGQSCPGSSLFDECDGDPDRTCAFRTEQMTAEGNDRDSSFRCPPY